MINFEKIKTNTILSIIKKGIFKENKKEPKSIILMFDKELSNNSLLTQINFIDGSSLSSEKKPSETVFESQIKEYLNDFESGKMEIDFINRKISFQGIDKNNVITDI